MTTNEFILSVIILCLMGAAAFLYRRNKRFEALALWAIENQGRAALEKQKERNDA